MPVAEGNTVKVHYTGTLEDGSVFDSSEGKEPLEFKVGEHKVIKGFEQAMIGMEKDEEKTVNIPKEEAYGERQEQLMKDLPKATVPEGMDIKEGMMIGLQGKDGQKIMARIAKIGEENVTIDLNHPLAGKNLTFKLKLVDFS